MCNGPNANGHWADRQSVANSIPSFHDRTVREEERFLIWAPPTRDVTDVKLSRKNKSLYFVLLVKRCANGGI